METDHLYVAPGFLDPGKGTGNGRDVWQHFNLIRSQRVQNDGTNPKKQGVSRCQNHDSHFWHMSPNKVYGTFQVPGNLFFEGRRILEGGEMPFSSHEDIRLSNDLFVPLCQIIGRKPHSDNGHRFHGQVLSESKILSPSKP